MTLTKTALIIAALAVLSSVAAESAPEFEKVPAQAMKELKGAVGKPLDSGIVFVNGRYIRPPYRVARMGTAIFINDVQVTGQINSWRKFLATQPGFTGQIPAKQQTPAVVKAKDLDDLFADDDPPAQEAKPEAPASASEPEVNFSANARSAELLREIDTFRAGVQRRLREGHACFFGSRYARVEVPPGLVKKLLEVLPDAMREADDGVDLESRIRARGIVFLNRTICNELIEHRPDYLKLIERKKALLEQERMEAMSRRNMQERGR